MCDNQSIRSFFSGITVALEIGVKGRFDEWNLIFEEVSCEFNQNHYYSHTVKGKNDESQLDKVIIIAITLASIPGMNKKIVRMWKDFLTISN